jgi:hypothetical protein
MREFVITFDQKNNRMKLERPLQAGALKLN